MTDSKTVDYKRLFDQTPVARFLVGKSSQGFFVISANDIALKFFDHPREEVINRLIDELFIPENSKRMTESLKVCMDKQSPVTVPSLKNVPGHFTVPGFWIYPIFDDEGVVKILDVVAQPSITDSSIVERERDDALLLLTSIFDASEVGILVFDRNRRIVKTNDSFERIFGWSRKDSLGKDFVDFLTDDAHKEALENFENYIKSGQRHSGEVKIHCKDGSIANTIYTTVTMELSHNRNFQVTTLVDITQRKQMEYSLKFAKEQADAANHAKSLFLANMSHELRTPLNAIIGFSEMIMNETFGPVGNDKYIEYLNDVHLSAKHLLEIINEVLDMSKIEAGRVELAEQDIDVKKLIETVMRMVISRVSDSNIQIHFNHPDEVSKLRADPRLVRQILINILTNAVKYTSKGGEIFIRLRTNTDDELVIEIEDRGIGIPSDKISDVMEPFGQIHEPTKSSVYQGTGLGLPLAKAMVELHDGKFKLHSVEGEGTKVTICFPDYRVIVTD